MWLLSILLFSSLKCIICVDVNLAGLFEKDESQEKTFIFATELVNNGQLGDDFTLIPHINNEITEDEPFHALRQLCSFLEIGVIAVFGPRSKINKDTIQGVCDMKEIPHIITWWNSFPVRHSTEINFYPHPPILAEAYYDIIKALGWETFTVLYEDDESFLRVSSLVKKTKDEGLLVQVMQLDENHENSYRTTIKSLKMSGQQYIVLDSHIQHLGEILKQLQQAGMINENFHYFITNLDTHTEDLTPFMFSNVKMTGIRIIDPNAENTQIISTDLFAGSELAAAWKIRTETALIIDAVFMFLKTLNERQKLSPVSIIKDNHRFSCSKFSSWEHGLSVINMLKTSTHDGLTGLISFNNEGFRSDFNLHVFELREGGITDIGNWNSSKGLNLTASAQSQNITDGDSLRNLTFNVLITLTEPYGMLKMTTEPQIGNDRFEGYGIDLIRKLADMEGFNYTFLVREDKKNGAYDKTTKKWTGMIGDLLDFKADLAICDFTITSDREEVVDFTVPFMTLGVSILFKEPVNAPPSFFSFADPFGLDTWIALAVSFFLVSFALYFMGRLCGDEWTNPYPCIEEPEYLTNQFSLANAIWFATGSLLAQGSEIGPIATSTRMGAGMWWYFCLIMSASYTANLAAFLATQNPVELFKDIDSLYENPHGIKYGAKEGGATLKFFTDAEEGTILRKIGDRMKDDPANVKENDEGVLKAENEDYAFFMESTSIEYATQRHCSLKQYGGLLDEKGYGIAMRKNSTYRKRLSLAILQLQTSHALDDLKKKWWEDRRGGGACGGPVESSEADPLGLVNVEGCFMVTIYGTMLALILVIIEHLCFVNKISRRAKIPFCKVFMSELRAYLDFNNNTKPNITQKNREGSDGTNGNEGKECFKQNGDSNRDSKDMKSKRDSKSGSRPLNNTSSRCCTSVHSRSRSRSISRPQSSKSKTSRSSGRKTPAPFGFVVPSSGDNKF
ncbi:unnamed protein product [Phaedon cochleariae]|uniref:Glutamate receptor ionotropic, kainate 2-like n=1 Tax=Phaedon cochleariae TaxID=80249 RepID=A0A9P0DTC8_PHACE|nr:unnamed protein product [Phaedon cochleariae]